MALMPEHEFLATPSGQEFLRVQEESSKQQGACHGAAAMPWGCSNACAAPSWHLMSGSSDTVSLERGLMTKQLPRVGGGACLPVAHAPNFFLAAPPICKVVSSIKLGDLD